MARLAFCDYRNMIAILEKSEHNVDLYQIVDFAEASHIRYALTINPTVYVSHIRQFWSTARIETTNEGTKILATVDGKPRTISESSIRRNLKLNDEEGISTLLDVELFKNLALMGYDILPNQKFTFQKGQFFHQWKFLIHTIMQCLSPKNTGFNEFSSNIATAVGEGSGTTTEPHHTSSPEAQQSPHHDLSSSLHPTETIETIPTKTPTEIPTLRQYSRRATWIAQSKALPTSVDEHVSLLRDDSQGEAFPTVSGLEAGQDRENIIKTSALPHDLTPRVTSLDADEGNLEISSLKARIKLLEDKNKGSTELSGDDAPIKGRSLETGELHGVEKSTERGSNDTEELVNVLTFIDAANILTSGVAYVSVPPAAEVLTVGVPTASGLVPTVSPIFTTSSMVTPYSRRPREISAKDKDKEKMVESDTPKKKKLQEQIDMPIDGLDRNNEVIAKHLQEYEQSKAELTIGEKIDLINELEQREFYISVLRSHSGWKTKHLKGKTLEEIREKFIPVWKKIEDFVPMASKEEGERVKKKGLKLEQGSAKKMNTLEDIHTEGKKDYWKIIRLGGHTAVYHFFMDMLKQFDREDLNQLWTLGKGSGTPTEPHHTPFPEVESSHPTTSSTPLPSIPTTPIPTVTQTDTTPIIQYSRRAKIAQSSALPTVADEPASPDRATIAKSSTLPHDSAPRVTSPAADEGKDREAVATKQSRENTPIKGRSNNEGDAAAERISNDSKEIAKVLTSMDATTVLAGETNVPTGSGFIPTAGPPTTVISTGSKVGPTASPIVTRRKGKEVMVESDTPKKKKLQEQIDAQVVRELEEQQEKENMRMNEQIARDAEVARIHAEEELQGMIDSLDKSNETIAKYLQEYQDFASELPLEKRIELIGDLVKYQDNYSKVYKFQSQQRRPMTKKQKREYYMAVIRSNLRWRVKDFKGMSFKEIKAKFAEVWKQVEDFIPMGSKEETKRLKRKGLNLEKERTKELLADHKIGRQFCLLSIFVEWKLYDLSGVHHLTAKDREIFMLVEKDYPLRKGLAFVMISYKLQVENYSQMAEDLIRNIYNIANTPR
nr:hypothetical protein [Tanacetum cinerariifolium]